jgi:hypothetical protein
MNAILCAMLVCWCVTFWRLNRDDLPIHGELATMNQALRPLLLLSLLVPPSVAQAQTPAAGTALYPISSASRRLPLQV